MTGKIVYTSDVIRRPVHMSRFHLADRGSENIRSVCGMDPGKWVEGVRLDVSTMVPAKSPFDPSAWCKKCFPGTFKLVQSWEVNAGER